MGIKHFYSFYKKTFPSSQTHKTITCLTSSTLLIDTSVLYYKYNTAMQFIKNSEISSIKDNFGNNISHIIGIISLIRELLKNDIKPIFIFDGKSLKEKKFEILRREKIKKFYENEKKKKIKEKNFFEALKFSKRIFKISENEIKMTMDFLEILGIEYFVSENESDKLLANLSKNVKNSYVLSTDSDILVHGAQNLVTNLKISKIPKKKILEKKNLEKNFFDLKKIKNDFGFLEQDEFICFCILLGSDYNNNIKNLGPMNALKFIKKFKNFDNFEFREILRKKFFFENFENLENIFKIFKNDENLDFEVNVKNKDRVDFERFEDIFLKEKIFEKKREESFLKNLEVIDELKKNLL